MLAVREGNRDTVGGELLYRRNYLITIRLPPVGIPEYRFKNHCYLRCRCGANAKHVLSYLRNVRIYFLLPQFARTLVRQNADGTLHSVLERKKHIHTTHIRTNSHIPLVMIFVTPFYIEACAIQTRYLICKVLARFFVILFGSVFLL